MAPPRTEMNFVDRYRSAQSVCARWRRLGTDDGVETENDRGGGGTQFGCECERIRLQREQSAGRVNDLIFVFRPGFHAGHENLPETIATHAHGVASAVPKVKITNHTHPSGIGCEYRECNTHHPFKRKWVRAELFVETPVRAFAQQVDIKVREHRWKTVRIFQLHDLVSEACSHVIARRAVRELSDKQAR